MTMGVWHPETADRVALEVEFDQHHRLLPPNPTVMTWLDRHDLRSSVFHDTTIGIFDVKRRRKRLLSQKSLW